MPKLAAFPKGFFNDLVQGTMSLFQWIDLAGRLGLDGVELYPKFFESFEPPYLCRVKEEARARGLEIPMMCHSPDFTQPDPAARAEEIQRVRRMLRVTAQLGGRFCRVLSGQNRPGLDPGQAHAWVVEAIHGLLPDAESANVVMVIENHYKDGLWEYPEFAQSHARYLAILDAVPSPWLKAQYDPSNAVVAGEDPYALLERVLPRLATIHASDRSLDGGSPADLERLSAAPRHGYAKLIRHGVIGQGLNDYDRIFSILARAGYDGWVSIEDGEAPTLEEGLANLQASVDFLRRKFAEHFPRPPKP